MAKNRVFFPQEALDAWIVSGAVEVKGHDLLLKSENRLYRMNEGVRILREVTGEPDAYDVVGKCKTVPYLRELGAELLENSMIIDNNAYDVVQGFLCVPLGASASETTSDKPARPPLASDEQLLADFLSKNM
jgi:hypothetical protein